MWRTRIVRQRVDSADNVGPWHRREAHAAVTGPWHMRYARVIRLRPRRILSADNIRDVEKDGPGHD